MIRSVAQVVPTTQEVEEGHDADEAALPAVEVAADRVTYVAGAMHTVHPHPTIQQPGVAAQEEPTEASLEEAADL